MHPIFTFPANYVIDKYGLKWGINIGGFLIILGCWIRTLVNSDFSFVILGFMISGIGRPFIMNA